MNVGDIPANETGKFWSDLSASLSQLLDLQDSSDIVQYLLSIDNENDVEEYLCGLLDRNNPDHTKFINTFLTKWKRGGEKRNVSTSNNVHIYRKADYNEEVTGARQKSKSRTTPTKSEINQHNADSFNDSKPESGTKSSKKHKYLPLYSEEGLAKSIVHLPGRHHCDCQAAKHKLINNCISCGRIVCEQEGSGPCLFCGKLVCTNEEQEIIDRNSKSSYQLYQKLMGDVSPKLSDANKNKEFQRAIEHKNKLLEYDRTVERRTKVIDDQSDYFTSDNRWLSKEERDAVIKRDAAIDARKAASRKATKVTFDFAGRQIVEEKENFDYRTEEEIQAELRKYMNRSNKENAEGLNPNAADLPRPMYVATSFPNTKRSHINLENESEKKNRLQGRELQEMSDEGWCLSLHQPYASLLIAGLKKHEGRVWYSALRGRLWIASTAKEPTSSDIQQMEKSIRFLNKEDDVIFPSAYPVGALLGCVDVMECLPQEEYRKKYPEGESESPYVFICENPQELIVKFPIRGQHKIYKLDSRIHDAAKKTIKKNTT